MYICQLTNEANSTCERLAVIAAKHNGKCEDISIADLVGIFKSEKLQYPLLNTGLTIAEQSEEQLTIKREKSTESGAFLVDALTIKKVAL